MSVVRRSCPQLPSMHLSDKNYIRISLNTLNNVKLQSAVFLSYR